MGWRDNLRETVETRQAENAGRKEASAESAATAVAGCPDPEKHYVSLVNKGSLDVTAWTLRLNGYFRNGYRLSHAFEQGGNTVTVIEHNHP